MNSLHGSAPVVAAKAEAAAVALAGVQAGPAAHLGVGAIGAHDPARADQAAIGATPWSEIPVTRAPQAMRTPACGGVFHHERCSVRAAQAKAVAGGESGLDAGAALAKADAAERLRRRSRPGRCRAARAAAMPSGMMPSPQALSMGGMAAVGQGDVEAAAARRDGRGKTGRASADHEHIGGAGKRGSTNLAPGCHRSKRASSCA